mmetsp:Transcript_17598/g.52870  ORF Transcript_17598/g.52870 Transcript_17598/m.52870 type:complete len:384 (-) Transcript_17598:3891-5042(-)
MSSVISQTAKPVDGFKWVQLSHIQWQDPTGKERQWEMASRTTRKGELDGIAVIAVVTGKGQPPRLVLEKQFRPPQGSYVIELPAGLVEAGESAAQAAVRELKEETGYTGTVGRISTVCGVDPGMTDANMVFVDIHIDADAPANRDVHPELDEGEFIDVFLLPLKSLYRQLVDLQSKDKVQVDARLLMYAAGLDDGAAYVSPNATTSSPAADDVSAADDKACAACGHCSSGNGAGFLEIAARSISRAGSTILLGRPSSPAQLPPPPAVEVTMAHPGSYASLRALDVAGGAGDGSDLSFGQPDTLHPQDSLRGAAPILMSTEELAAAGVVSVRIVPRGTLRWRRLDRWLLAAGVAGLVAGLACSQVVVGMALAIGSNYHPARRIR